MSGEHLDHFGEALALMKRDASFAVGVWQLSYLDREGSIGLTEKRRRVDELGQKLAVKKGIVPNQAQDWLADNVHHLSDYFEGHHKFGTLQHRASGLALLFGSLLLERRLPSKLERDAILPALANLFFAIALPFLALVGAIVYRPIVTGWHRLFFMAFGLFQILVANLKAYEGPQGSYRWERARRGLGGRGLITPLRMRLSEQSLDGIGKGMVVYGVGTFVNQAFTVWELIIALATGLIIVYQMMKTLLSPRESRSGPGEEISE
jgi:hypothetical protein